MISSFVQNWIKSREVAKEKNKRVVVLQLDLRIARLFIALAIISCASFSFAGWSYYNSGNKSALSENQRWRLDNISPREWTSSDVLAWADSAGLHEFRKGFRRYAVQFLAHKTTPDVILVSAMRKALYFLDCVSLAHHVYCVL
jgi:hypothetical protein